MSLEDQAPVAPAATTPAPNAAVTPPVTQTPAPTPPTEPTPPVQTPEELDFARRFTALTRKEREVLAREERMRGDLDGMSEWKKNQDLIKSNPLEFLKRHGWEFNKLAEFALNDNKPTQAHTLEALQKRIDDMEAEKAAEKSSKSKADEEKNIQTYKDNLKNQLVEKSEKFELLNHYEQYDMVYDILNQHFIATSDPKNGIPGEVLDIDMVAEQVEKYLEGQLEKATKTKKFSSRFAPTPPPALDKSGTPGTTGQEKTPPTTLTNDVVSASNPSTTSTYLDEDASKARSARMLQEAWNRGKTGQTS